jgi:hypothetical protein
MRGPGLAMFRLYLCEPHARRRIRDADEVVTGRTLNLASGELSFALQRLIAVGTIEFEFVRVHSLCPHKRKTARKSILKILHTFCRQTALALLDELR